jgi:ABC-type transport system involved in multi-copper enzyme maturation permease subunit
MRQENPVFWYHLLGQSRYRWRKQRAMTIIASVLIGLLYLYLLQQTLEYEVEPIFTQLLGLLLICLLIPLGSYSLFSAEYEKATWESLAITPLTVDQIVFGKWFSRVLGVLVVVLIMTPLSFVAWLKSFRVEAGLLGWLGSQWMLLSWGVLLVSLGMWLSFRVRHSIASAALLYGIQVFVLLFLPLLVYTLFSLAVTGTYLEDPFRYRLPGEPSWGDRLWFWLSLPFDWRCVFWLNPYLSMEPILTTYSSEQARLLRELGFGWGQGLYYGFFSWLLYWFTRQGVRRHWRK